MSNFFELSGYGFWIVVAFFTGFYLIDLIGDIWKKFRRWLKT